MKNKLIILFLFFFIVDASASVKEKIVQNLKTTENLTFNFEQNVDDQRLANYLSLVGGGTVGSQTIQPVFKNRGLSALGGGLGGAQLAQHSEPPTKPANSLLHTMGRNLWRATYGAHRAQYRGATTELRQSGQNR